MTPRISIVIPVYNVEKYIARCLDSCTNQTYENIEIVIVDDFGSDKSMDIAKEYANKDKRIKIVSNTKNLGLFHARIEGAKVASGDYILPLDSDDFIRLDTCEIISNAIETTAADIIHFGMCHYPKTLLRIPTIVKSGFLYDDTMRYFLNTGNNSQGMWDKAMKREIVLKSIQKLSFVKKPLLMLEDGLFVLVASMESHSYFGVKEAMYRYCYNPVSISRDESKKNVSFKVQQIDFLLDMLSKLKKIYPQHKKLIEQYARKVVSVMMIGVRNTDASVLLEALNVASKHGYIDLIFPKYIFATLLSLRYAYRWQNLVRLVLYIFSFGKIRM